MPLVCAGCGSGQVAVQLRGTRLAQPTNVGERGYCETCWALLVGMLDTLQGAIGRRELIFEPKEVSHA